MINSGTTVWKDTTSVRAPISSIDKNWKRLNTNSILNSVSSVLVVSPRINGGTSKESFRRTIRSDGAILVDTSINVILWQRNTFILDVSMCSWGPATLTSIIVIIRLFIGAINQFLFRILSEVVISQQINTFKQTNSRESPTRTTTTLIFNRTYFIQGSPVNWLGNVFQGILRRRRRGWSSLTSFRIKFAIRFTSSRVCGSLISTISTTLIELKVS